MSPEELFALIQISSPMTHKIEGCDRVARYPVDQRERSGRRAFTVQSWCELALKIATNDEEGLHKVMKVVIMDLNNEDNMDPEEVKRLKKRQKLRDSTQTMLDDTEISAEQFGDTKSEKTTAVSSFSGHQ
eukprot:1247996-Pyramimonas_sp.AAC.1